MYNSGIIIYELPFRLLYLFIIIVRTLKIFLFKNIPRKIGIKMFNSLYLDFRICYDIQFQIKLIQAKKKREYFWPKKD